MECILDRTKYYELPYILRHFCTFWWQILLRTIENVVAFTNQLILKNSLNICIYISAFKTGLLFKIYINVIKAIPPP